MENAEKALSYVLGMDYDAFCTDEKAVYAVIRAFEIIGEAARQITEDVCQSHPEILWREIAAMRNKLTREYFGINTKVISRTVQEDLPALIPRSKKLLQYTHSGSPRWLAQERRG
jgi:uncharacterized protein with HEPN domain